MIEAEKSEDLQSPIIEYRATLSPDILDMDFKTGNVNKRPSTQENGRRRGGKNQKGFNSTGFKSQYGISYNNNEIRAKQIGFIH